MVSVPLITILPPSDSPASLLSPALRITAFDVLSVVEILPDIVKFSSLVATSITPVAVMPDTPIALASRTLTSLAETTLIDVKLFDTLANETAPDPAMKVSSPAAFTRPVAVMALFVLVSDVAVPKLVGPSNVWVPTVVNDSPLTDNVVAEDAMNDSRGMSNPTAPFKARVPDPAMLKAFEPSIPPLSVSVVPLSEMMLVVPASVMAPW